MASDARRICCTDRGIRPESFNARQCTRLIKLVSSDRGQVRQARRNPALCRFFQNLFGRT